MPSTYTMTSKLEHDQRLRYAPSPLHCQNDTHSTIHSYNNYCGLIKIQTTKKKNCSWSSSNILPLNHTMQRKNRGKKRKKKKKANNITVQYKQAGALGEKNYIHNHYLQNHYLQNILKLGDQFSSGLEIIGIFCYTFCFYHWIKYSLYPQGCIRTKTLSVIKTIFRYLFQIHNNELLSVIL